MSSSELVSDSSPSQDALTFNIGKIEEWLESHDDKEVSDKLEEFKNRQTSTSDPDANAELNNDVAQIMKDKNIEPIAYDGGRGRRRKYSRRGRRSAKKRGTQRKQKRRQRRGSRRAY